MKRLGVVALVGLLIVALAGGTALAARRPTSFQARASDSHAGGRLRVMARVVRPDRHVDFSASAVVHLKSGDVAVTMESNRRAYVAHGRIRVPRDEACGEVMVDVTIMYGGTPQLITVGSMIKGDACDDNDDGDGDGGGGGGGSGADPTQPPADPAPEVTPSPEPPPQS